MTTIAENGIYHIGKIESTKDEKLPVEANSICDETLAGWPSEHNTHKCTAKEQNQKGYQYSSPFTQEVSSKASEFFPPTYKTTFLPERNLG